jgi:hypothetical protein
MIYVSRHGQHAEERQQVGKVVEGRVVLCISIKHLSTEGKSLSETKP